MRSPGYEFVLVFAFLLCLFEFFGCAAPNPGKDGWPGLALAQSEGGNADVPAAKKGPIPIYAVRIVKTYPHDPGAFTQGLVYVNGFLCESTGLKGRSSLRVVELESGRIVRKTDLPEQYFGEGLTLWQDTFIQLTWRSNRGFVYNAESLALTGSFSYPGEGWGLTHDGTSLIMSTGGSSLVFLNPHTFTREGILPVVDRGRPVPLLNELEYIKGEIFANVWLKDVVARICPKTGIVTGWIDMSSLRGAFRDAGNAEALNGMAYDPDGDRLFITGKFWPNVFQVEITGPVSPEELRKPLPPEGP